MYEGSARCKTELAMENMEFAYLALAYWVKEDAQNVNAHGVKVFAQGLHQC